MELRKAEEQTIPFGTHVGDSETRAHRDISETPEWPEIPGYRILSLLGRGGMGEVYLAEHLALRRRVAIKVISVGFQSSPLAIARFQSEALAVASVTHPGVCQIFEAGQVGPISFLSMEYIDGPTLSQVIRDSPPSPTQASIMAKSIAEAVHACHLSGILHRDLKPANVMLTRSGSIKLMDFGLAKRFTESQSANTCTGDVVGTPSYMAPEQASGLVKQLGPECDVYGVGAILYEMLVGRPPHYGEAPLQTMLQVLTVEPVAPRSLQSRIPRDLETVCLKCLEKQAKKRYRSAESVAEELGRFLTQRPILARSATPVERGIKWSRRHPATTAWICMALLLLGTSAIAVSFHLYRLQVELDRSERLFAQSQDWGRWLVENHIPSMSRLRGGDSVRESLIERTLQHLTLLETDVAADRTLATYIAHTYEHIADVESEFAFATPLGLEKAISNYDRAAALYSRNLVTHEKSIPERLAKLFLKISRIHESLRQFDQARVAVDKSIAIMKEVRDTEEPVLLVEAKVQRLNLDAAGMQPQDLYRLYYELYTQLRSTANHLRSDYNEVLATLATKLGDCLVLDVEAISVPADRKEARIAYYKHASELLSAAVATDERLRFELSRVLTKLAESFEAADRHTEAIESWSHALSQQQRLVQEVPESDIYRLELVSTLENQFRIAREQRNLAREFEIATLLFSECQRLFQLDPDRYSREMRQAYLYLSHAHRDAGREEAMEWMEKACTEARRVSQLHSDSNDSRALADFLYQHALLLLEFVDKRSDTGRRIKALEKSIEHLNESTSIYDSLGESTTTELGSPFWSAIDFKHRIEDELEYLKKIHQESNRASNVFLNQEK